MIEQILFFAIYSIQGYSNVVLIGITINETYDHIDLMKFTQSIDGVDMLDWQVPYEEKYLNAEGTEIIGDEIEPPTNTSKSTRIVFFFHELNVNQKFETPFGKLEPPTLEPLPERLKSLVSYNPMD